MIYFILTAAFLLVVCLSVSYVCFRMAFYSKSRHNEVSDEPDLPSGEEYQPFLEDMTQWVLEKRAYPSKTYQIQTPDGLTLVGHYYEYHPNAPIELMFHGYRGTAERDLSGGVHRAMLLGHSAFLVEQRGSGRSDGNVISFGIKEHKDCLLWIDFLIHTFGPDIRIILTGISMGASTVLTAAGTSLPENVIGVLADCGFTTAKEMIKIVVGRMNLPPKLCYPFIRLGARLFGGFKLEETSALKAMETCRVPVLFIHGDGDKMVPWEMSKRNFDACNSKKQLLIVSGAGHGLAFPVAPELYVNTMKQFFGC